MSQTMATKHLTSLEDRLGTRLMHRTTRRLTLTEAGRHYLESAERILAEVEEADGAAMADRVDVHGTLRINAPLSFGFRELTPLIIEFSRENPAITVDMGLNDRVVDLIEEGWDIAIRIGQLRNSAMMARRLAPCRLVVVASPAYLAAHGTPRTIADLAGHNCLGYTLSSALGPTAWGFGRDGKIRTPIAGRFRANNGDALVAAAVAGYGIAYEPTFNVGHELRAGRLVALTFDQPTMELPGIFAVYPADRHPPAKIRAFLDFLGRRLGPNPPWDRDLPI